MTMNLKEPWKNKEKQQTWYKKVLSDKKVEWQAIEILIKVNLFQGIHSG